MKIDARTGYWLGERATDLATGRARRMVAMRLLAAPGHYHFYLEALTEATTIFGYHI